MSRPTPQQLTNAASALNEFPASPELQADFEAVANWLGIVAQCERDLGGLKQEIRKFGPGAPDEMVDMLARQVSSAVNAAHRSSPINEAQAGEEASE